MTYTELANEIRASRDMIDLQAALVHVRDARRAGKIGLTAYLMLKNEIEKRGHEIQKGVTR